MDERSVELPRTHEGAARIAGLLAEAGVLSLVVRDVDGTSRTLAARQTDLPGELLSAKVGTRIEAELEGAGGVCIEVCAAVLRVSGPDATLKTWHATLSPFV